MLEGSYSDSGEKMLAVFVVGKERCRVASVFL